MPQGGNGGGPAKGVNKILGNWKDDLLIGTDGEDAIYGREGNDTLIGGGSGDILDGGDGNDTLSDFLGDNTLDGGAGDDTLSVNGSNNDVLTGGSGADIFSLVGELPYVNGTVATTTITDFEPGTDLIVLPVEFDVLAAAVQDGTNVVIEFAPGLTLVLLDTLKADLSASDFTFAGPGVIDGTAGNDSLVGGFGNDVISGLDGSDYLSGGAGDDTLYGHSASQVSLEAETLLGGAGDDLLVGGFGGDVMDGGDGNDVLSIGTLGDHTVTGGAGFDAFEFITGIEFGTVPDLNQEPANLVTVTDFEIGVDQIRLAVPEFDVLAAAQEQGSDVLIIYSGERGILLQNRLAGDLLASDFVFVPASHQTGTEGPDVLVGTDAGDILEGLGGDDVLSALGGEDFLDGGAGNDTLFGGTGNDTLLGGDGDDLLIGRTGDDLMTGGTGADVFGIRIPPTSVPWINTLDNQGTDTIIDFEIGIDVIRFGWTAFTVLPFATQVGTDVHIDYATGSTLVLQNTSLAALQANGEASFVFDSTPVEDPGLL